jgi:hypothetical protein
MGFAAERDQVEGAIVSLYPNRIQAHIEWMEKDVISPSFPKADLELTQREGSHGKHSKQK